VFNQTIKIMGQVNEAKLKYHISRSGWFMKKPRLESSASELVSCTSMSIYI